MSRLSWAAGMLLGGRMVTALRFFLLGPFELLAGTRPLLSPPTAKSQSLLAYLILHRDRPSSREQLAGLFWGDRTERKARRSLATALWHIRSCLEEQDVLLSDNTTAQLDPAAGVWLDVDEFETLARRPDRTALEAAIALYRGPLLPALYDDWVIDRRYQLETRYLEALGRLMRLQDRAGAPADALVSAWRLLANDPLREEAHRMVMRAYCNLGDRDAALAHYRHAERIIERELGAPPVADTRLLYQAILDGRVEVGPRPDVGPPSPAPAATPQGRHPLEAALVSPLVGRDTELALLDQHWQAALAGGGALVLIEGEAGVGKTRLLDEFARELRRQGAWVSAGRCYTFERLLSYQPLVEVLSGLSPLLPEREWEALPAWARAALGRLLPDLGPGPAPAPSGSEPAGPAGEQERLFEAVTRLLHQIAAHRPLLIVLEDLHWATESTLGLVHYLARRLTGHSILVAATHRPITGTPSHPLNALRDALVGDRIAMSWQLAPLSEGAVLELVERMSGAGGAAAPFARRLYLETEGNPFFLSEIVKSLFDTGRLMMDGPRWKGDFDRLGATKLPLPATVSQTILLRVGSLDEPAQQALRYAAVLGREFDFAPFCHLCGRDEEAALAFLDTFLRRRLITEGSGRLGRDYAFTHHKIQEAVYAELSRRARQRLHALAGPALEESCRLVEGTLHGQVAGEPGVVLPAELAFHFAEGRAMDPALSARAVRYQLAAGDAARCLYAHQEAVEFYRQALTILKEQNEFDEVARTLTKLGLVYHNAFDFARARETYDEAFAYWHRAEAAGHPATYAAAPHPLRVQSEEPFQLDPARHADSATQDVIRALFSGLVQQGRQLEILPEVAERWDVLDGGRRYVFHLRPTARWSDGEPVSAGDFVYAWRRVLDPSTADGIANRLFNVRGARDRHEGRGDQAALGVQAPDAHMLVVELEAPCGYFLNLIADAVALPVPVHRVKELGDAWALPENLVGNGAFRLRSWVRGESMVLARNPDYHARFGGNVEEVVLHFVPPWSTGLEMYAADALDLIQITYLRPPDLEAARQLYAGDYRCLSRLATGYTGFDTRRPPFDDRRVRQAFALAVDREALARTIRGDQVLPATGGFVPPGMPGHTAGIALPFDPSQARRLLAEAGYPNGRGFPPIMSILPDVPGSETVRKFVVDQWRELLGVDVQGEAIALDRYRAVLEGGHVHLMSEALRAEFPDPAEFLDGSGPLMNSGWHDPRYHALIDEARRSLDQGVRMRLYAQAERILVAEAPLVPLFYMRAHLLVKPWVRHFPAGGSDRYAWKDLALDPHP